MAKKQKNDLKKYLDKKYYLPGLAVLVLLLLFTVKFPYQAQESYTELEEYEEQVQEDDLDNPYQKEVCGDVDATVVISEDYPPYVKPFGLNEFICYKEFKVTNQETIEGDWTYKYTFTINGIDYPVDAITKTIPPSPASLVWKFESDECDQGDSVTGSYELVSGPTVSECYSETAYRTKTVTLTKTREVPKERIVTKYESLFQKLLGLNKKEKV